VLPRPGADALDVPPGVRTVVCVGDPPRPGFPAAGEVSGWVADVPAPYVGDGVWLGAGCVAASANRIPPRGLAAAPAGWIAPDRLVTGETAVTTRFAGPARVLAIELGGGGMVDDVALGLDGARRPVGPDGRERPPVVVTDGSRTVLVYDLLAKDPFTVTAVTARSRTLGGVAAVAGRPETAASVATAIAGRGLAALLPPTTVDGFARSRVRWKEPPA
jgi:hypothetical protein